MNSSAPPPEGTFQKSILIALCGVTGAGKTTFASLASGRTDLKIGHDVDPCTQEPQTIDFELDGRIITLVDTPGFDDDIRSDVEILEGIATWMAKRELMKEQLLDGLIFLHPITVNRVGGSEWNRTRLLEKILGRHAYQRVIIATTMWDDIRDEAAVQRRLDGRTRAGGVWYELNSRGAKVMTHYNNKQSAQNIIKSIIKTVDKLGKTEPLLHTELRRHHGRVVRTSAGKELKKQLEETIRQIEQAIEIHDSRRPVVTEEEKKIKDHPKREEHRAWRKERNALEERLSLRQQQLKRLGSMTVRFKRFFAALFGGGSKA